MEGKTQSEELVDKVEPVATYFYWAVKHCQGNSETLRTMLDNIVDHNQNNQRDVIPAPGVNGIQIMSRRKF